MSFTREVELARPLRISPSEEKRKNISCLIDALSQKVKGAIIDRAKSIPNNGMPFSCSGCICLGTSGDLIFKTIIATTENKKKRFLDWDCFGRPLFDIYTNYSLSEDGRFVLEELRKLLKEDNIRVNFTLSFGSTAQSDCQESFSNIGVYDVTNVFGSYAAGELPVTRKETPKSVFVSCNKTNNSFKEISRISATPGVFLEFLYG